MIAVVDYCKGNLKSVERGLRSVGGDASITDDPAVIAQAEAIVLPGVGAFKDASDTMMTTGQMQAIRDTLSRGVPFLGICLGEHLLFSDGTEGSEEGKTAAGLGIISGVVDRLPDTDDTGVRYKVPHVGWNSVEFDSSTIKETCPLMEGIKSGEYFYFTHSFCAPESDCTRATTTHSITFPSIVRAGEYIYGVQFHPEKSSDAGAAVLKNFLNIVKRSQA